jgi:hypothetical protein
MPTAPHDKTRIPRAKIAELLKLIKRADSVEVKVVVPMSGHRATIKSIGMDPIEAEPRQVFFFDTPRLDLYEHGLIVRARRIQGGGGDSVVKLRPVKPENVRDELRRSDRFKIEVDAVPGGFVCSGSFSGRCSAQEVLDAASGETRLSSLLSKGQRRFFKEHAPTTIGKKTKMNALLTLGPLFVLKGKLKPKKLARVLTVELWLFPDGSRNLEISTKCKPDEAFTAAAELRTFLDARGVEIAAGQETKTAAAMKFFAAHRRLALCERRAIQHPAFVVHGLDDQRISRERHREESRPG